MNDFDHIPKILNEPIFQKAFRIAELANLSPAQHMDYERNLLDYWTTKAAFDTARDEGREEGLKEGREEGIKQGEEKGRKEGKKEVAAILRQKGLSRKEILEITGLTADEI
uniref:Transposase/invertase (TIGR01784 family) n=1 Tax=Candidatus Kentrum sp. MB TaxID=2138164 RepID=A0A450Y020_9GAMM|nr:MAG: conserved hypothetical protein (putative transposase or invertase) [Candidatus Kentron sp. MB]VFK34880.1 MAG: conserved hypothetical protein (putative transposase or invertase) [Candidatus Kentron sp. MB]VFK77017.1 MAG: conserved hypothetical protein (putative transposase or invertase) [Candidatus Kentron sp. MB]